MSGLSSGAFERSYQTSKHSADFFGIRDEHCCFINGHEVDALPQFHLGLQFIVGSVRVPQMMSVFAGVVTSEALRDVRRSGDPRFAYLVTECELVFTLELSREAVAALGDVHGLLPHEQVSKRIDFGHAFEQSKGAAAQF